MGRSQQQSEAESVKSCLEAKGREAGFYWLSRALLLGSSFLLFQQYAGTLPFLINLVSGTKDTSQEHFPS